MGAYGLNNAGRTPERARDILLIDDMVQFDEHSRVRVEECEGSTIITTDSEQRALVLLGLVEVDLIWNFIKTGKQEDAERFRSSVLTRYPKSRLMDMWTPTARRDGVENKHILPLYMRDEFNCADLRRMWMENVSAVAERPQELSVDNRCAVRTQSL